MTEEFKMSNRDNIHMNMLNYLDLVLKELSFFDNSTFYGRIIFQKSIFLLQKMGLSLKYNFSLYINGPYSSDLADDGYSLSKTGLIGSDGNLTNEEKALIGRFKDTMRSFLKEPLIFEAIATYVYLKNEANAMRQLYEKKPYLKGIIDEKTVREISSKLGF